MKNEGQSSLNINTMWNTVHCTIIISTSHLLLFDTYPSALPPHHFLNAVWEHLTVWTQLVHLN